MSRSSAQNVHANNPQGAMDASLHKFDIDTHLNGPVDPTATAAGDMYWGNGNSPDGYHISDNDTLGIELALKEHVRTTGPDEVHTAGADGVADVSVPHGVDPTNSNRAAWNFDYVVDTGINGSHSNLDDFTFKLQITQTQNGVINNQIWDLNPATHVWTNELNPASHFGGDDFGGHSASDQVQSQVSENSENLAFLGDVFGGLSSATTAGTTYDIQLEAFQGVQLVNLVTDHVILV